MVSVYRGFWVEGVATQFELLCGAFVVVAQLTPTALWFVHLHETDTLCNNTQLDCLLLQAGTTN